MKYDLRALDPEEFETILLRRPEKAKGFRVRRFAQRGQLDRGIDYLAESSEDDTLYVVQVKRFSRNQVPMSDLRRVLLDLNRAIAFAGAQMGLLMTTVKVPASVTDELPPAPNVLVWDADMLESILDHEPAVLDEFLRFRNSEGTIQIVYRTGHCASWPNKHIPVESLRRSYSRIRLAGLREGLRGHSQLSICPSASNAKDSDRLRGRAG